MKNKKEIVVIQDTREQQPLALERYGYQVMIDTLPIGDYTVKYPNLSDILVIERKSLADFVACCGRERERFEKELLALRSYEQPYIIGEFGMRDIMGHNYRSQINPNSVMSSIVKWAGWGIQFLMCDDAQGASYVAAKVIEFSVKRCKELAEAKFDVPDLDDVVPPWTRTDGQFVKG